VRVRRDASEAFLASQDLTPFRIVHLGTHAYVDQRSVARTALALAPGGGKDGFLTVAEFSALRLDADLLTLSSCRTGQGVVAGSEGLQGLVTAAFEAGARAVLASNWTVADRAAAEFTTRFYREAAKGATLDEALAATKRGLARDGRPAREWAAFSLWGNGLARLPLRLDGATPR
jgi:CHAT domain-containing protein